jgi:hypothetical protein
VGVLPHCPNPPNSHDGQGARLEVIGINASTRLSASETFT